MLNRENRMKLAQTVACTLMFLVSAPALAAERVTLDNYVRAETDNVMAVRSAKGCFGKFCIESGPAPIDGQTVPRMNRDTPYSQGVFDLTTPLTIVKPDTGKRFQSILVINQDHYIKKIIYEPGTYILTRDSVGSRYVYVAVRTFMDPNDPKDVAEGRKAQLAVTFSQSSPGKLDLPDWDVEQLEKLRAALLTATPFIPDSKGMFGDVSETDPVRHLFGTAGGWGGNRMEDAVYLNVTPPQNDGQLPYTVTVKDVPVDAFWSITAYNKDGMYEAPENSISVNSVTAKKNSDGSTTVHFGGDPKAANYLRTMPGWNYTVRLYRPRKEILDGSWSFPEPHPVR